MGSEQIALSEHDDADAVVGGIDTVDVDGVVFVAVIVDVVKTDEGVVDGGKVLLGVVCVDVVDCFVVFGGRVDVE